MMIVISGSAAADFTPKLFQALGRVEIREYFRQIFEDPRARFNQREERPHPAVNRQTGSERARLPQKHRRPAHNRIAFPRRFRLLRGI